MASPIYARQHRRDIGNDIRRTSAAHPKRMRHKNKLRNRKIYAAYLAGQTIEALADSYKLHIGTMKHILNSERLKHAVSKEDFYRECRTSRTDAHAPQQTGNSRTPDEMSER